MRTEAEIRKKINELNVIDLDYLTDYWCEKETDTKLNELGWMLEHSEAEIRERRIELEQMKRITEELLKIHDWVMNIE